MVYDINKRTAIQVTIVPNGTLVDGSRQWVIDGEVQSIEVNALDTIIIPANTFAAGNHTISFSAANSECGSNTLTRTLEFIDGSAQPLNLIVNGTFDTELFWGWYSNSGGTATFSNGEVVINLNSASSNSQLYQDITSNLLEPNARYKVSFEYKGNSSRSEIIKISPTYNPIDSHIIPVTTTKTLYEYTFQTGSSIPSNLRFRFLFTSAGVYNIDNIALIKIGDISPPQQPSINPLVIGAGVALGFLVLVKLLQGIK